MSTVQPSDKILLAADDEQSAFRQLYDRYWQPLYHKAINSLGGDADAQDVVQEVFISLWRNRSKINVEESLAPYLFTALKYCIIKRVYRQAKKGMVLPLSLNDLERTDLTTEEWLQYKELKSVVNKEVSRLPQRMQEIYHLNRNENLSVTEIAGLLNLSEQTVKNTLTTALKKLRQKLSGHLCYIFLVI